MNALMDKKKKKLRDAISRRNGLTQPFFNDTEQAIDLIIIN